VTSPQPPPGYRADIDGLRAVAVLSVVAYHAFPAWARAGFLGVDVFFVISGYLITGILLGGLRKGTFSLADFYVRRVRRIFPALLVVLAAALAFGWFALLADEYKSLGKHAAGGAGFVSNFLLRGEAGYFDPAADTKPLLHLWSLAIEEQFYLVWPLLLWAGWRLRLPPSLLLGGLAATSFGVNLAQFEGAGIDAFYGPFSRVWELLLGAGLAWRQAARLRPAAPPGVTHALSLAGAGGIAAGLVWIQPDAYPGWWALLPTLGAALLIAAGPGALVNRAVLANPVLGWFGLISFPLYLWHWPLLSFTRVARSAWPAPPVAAVLAVAAIALSALTYYAVERPLRFGPGARPKALALAAAMLVMAAAGYAVFRSEGLPTRATVADFAGNRNEILREPPVDTACLAYAGAPPRFMYCRFHDARGTQTVAIVGDSHARFAFPGLAAWLAGRGVNTVLLGEAGCPPLVGAPAGRTPAWRAQCRERTGEIHAILAAKPDIRTVIFIIRGTFYLTGLGFGAVESNLNGTPQLSAAEFTRGIRDTEAALARLGKRFIFVRENPELGFDPLGCIPRPLRSVPASCVLDRAAIERRQRPYDEALRAVTGVTVVGVLDALCPEGRCPALRNGELLYADDDHLSIAGSRLLTEQVLVPVLSDVFPAVLK
jgi:peptidoglycan/LPS O-acetylase OafA/YrhL